MDAAYFVLGASFLSGLVGGGLAGLGFRAASNRRCSRLEWAVGDLQERFSTFKGQKASKARWDKEAQTDIELERLMHAPAAPTRKYDNDPLG
jgi:hypothetical protein